MNSLPHGAAPFPMNNADLENPFSPANGQIVWKEVFYVTWLKTVQVKYAVNGYFNRSLLHFSLSPQNNKGKPQATVLRKVSTTVFFRSITFWNSFMNCLYGLAAPSSILFRSVLQKYQLHLKGRRGLSIVQPAAERNWQQSVSRTSSLYAGGS